MSNIGALSIWLDIGMQPSSGCDFTTCPLIDLSYGMFPILATVKSLIPYDSNAYKSSGSITVILVFLFTKSKSVFPVYIASITISNVLIIN